MTTYTSEDLTPEFMRIAQIEAELRIPVATVKLSRELGFVFTSLNHYKNKKLPAARPLATADEVKILMSKTHDAIAGTEGPISEDMKHKTWVWSDVKEHTEKKKSLISSIFEDQPWAGKCNAKLFDKVIMEGTTAIAGMEFKTLNDLVDSWLITKRFQLQFAELTHEAPFLRNCRKVLMLRKEPWNEIVSGRGPVSRQQVPMWFISMIKDRAWLDYGVHTMYFENQHEEALAVLSLISTQVQYGNEYTNRIYQSLDPCCAEPLTDEQRAELEIGRFKNDKYGDSKTVYLSLYQRMLTVVRGCSVQRAKAISAIYPSLKVLLAAWDKRKSREEKELMLTLVKTGAGTNKQSSIPANVATELCKVFYFQEDLEEKSSTKSKTGQSKKKGETQTSMVPEATETREIGEDGVVVLTELEESELQKKVQKRKRSTKSKDPEQKQTKGRKKEKDDTKPKARKPRAPKNPAQKKAKSQKSQSVVDSQEELQDQALEPPPEEIEPVDEEAEADLGVPPPLHPSRAPAKTQK